LRPGDSKAVENLEDRYRISTQKSFWDDWISYYVSPELTEAKVHMKTLKLTLMLVLLVGCQARPAKPTILDNPVCEFPCWQNINPGVTTKSEFLDILSTLEYVDRDSIYSDDTVWQGFQGRAGCRLFLDSKHPISLHAQFLEDKVARILFLGDTGITLGQAIEILGEPSDVAISGSIVVALINSEKGISFGYNDIGKPNWVFSEIRPEVEVDTVIFYDPDAFESKINGGLFSSGSTIYTWKGFGEIDALYPLP
jgi:hypothetical protein